MLVKVLDADYSAALTLLLRYPAPLLPSGPSSFVYDALYLRDTGLLEGGAHIISKYSGKAPLPPLDVSRSPKSYMRRFASKGSRAKSQTQDDARKPASLIASPAKFLKDQGGIEGIIQEAARGVYNRGEQWGVARALRGAVQGLQSGTNPPRRPPNGFRWSLADGKTTFDTSPDLAAKVNALERRSQALAKLLENAVEDLWVQQKQHSGAEVETEINALSLALAKVQFVQVYLENPSMPFPAESASQETTEAAQSTSPPTTTADDQTGPKPLPPSVIPSRPQSPAGSTPRQAQEIVRANAHSASRSTSLAPAPAPDNSSQTAAKPAGVARGLERSPFHQPRPSLEHSSFSWMLGEDQRKSSFVSASPFPSAKRQARGKAGFLFGDDPIDGRKSATPPHHLEGASDGEETISLGELKGEAEERAGSGLDRDGTGQADS